MTFTRDEYAAMVDWLMGDNVGASSKAILGAAIGGYNGFYYPCDPSDFNRCLLMLEAVPSAWVGVSRLAQKHEKWAVVDENWDRIKESFLEEAGYNWSKSNNAPKTYKLMKMLGI